jgi:hypothetical protein
MRKLINWCEQNPIRTIIGIVVIWLLWPAVIRILVPLFQSTATDALQPMGQYGDTYGAFTALTAALGLLGVAATFLQQRMQIQLQQDQHTEEMARLIRQQRSEDDERKVQQRIDRFYSHLGWWEQSSREIEYDNLRGAHALCQMENHFLGALVKRPGEYFGHFSPNFGPMGDWIGYDVGEYMGAVRTVMEPVQTFIVPSQRQCVPEVFMRFYEERIGAIMGHIFRMQSDLVKYVHRERRQRNISQEIELHLIGSYKALLTDPDIHLLLYYGLSGLDDEFRDLMIHYDLLNWLRQKPRVFICHRIPELVEYYPELISSDQNPDAP